MKGMHVLASTLASLALSVCASAADIRTIDFSQILERPPGQTFTQFARNVAIDGTNIIVLATYDGGQSALLYQRASGSARFTYRSTLLTSSEPQDRMQVRMKNGIAVVQFGSREWIFERSGSTYVPGVAASPLNHPGGVAISGNSILIGGDDCGYDGVVYQKGTDGQWHITGRLDDNAGQCVPEGLAVELNYDYALIHAPGTQEVTTWRRNDTNPDWVSAGTMTINAEVAATSAPFALQNSTVVTPGSYVFRRQGSAWTAQGRVVPADYGMGSGNASEVKYRDGVLVTLEHWLPNYRAGAYVYLETAPGYFEHVAILRAELGINNHDVSGRTVVAGVSGSDGGSAVIYALPDPLVAPATIATDFEDGDASGFTAVSGQFTIAARGSNHVLAQTSTSTYDVALADDSDSNYFQRIEADITPSYGPPEGWVGLIARYTDANNFYYVAVRKDGTGGLYRRLNGVNTALRSWTGGGPPQFIRLVVSDDSVGVSINHRFEAFANDRSLPRGRAGLVTYHAAADFDNLEIAATDATYLVQKRFAPDSDVNVTRGGREFSHIGGDWQYIETIPPFIEGYQQRDPNRSAFAFIGAQVRNQVIDAKVQFNSVSSQSAAWVGLLGRYVDAQNHYFATLGFNGVVQIRKRVNGVVTLLGSTNLPLRPDAFNRMTFRLVDDQLQLFINDRRMLSVHDDAIPEGAHGLATNRSAATWEYMNVTQP
jgi:hypothetical protein